MTQLTSDKDFEMFVNNNINRDKAGEIIVNKLRLMLEGTVGRPTELTEAINYEIDEKGNINVYSDTPIPKFLDQGTDPYTIRPKKGKALKFRAGEVAQYKTGKKINFGDYVIVKEVKHPGIQARPFIDAGLHLAKQELKKDFI